MNKSKIETCDYTFNPVSGCLHGCEYCYASKIVKRFGMPQVDNDCHVVSGKIKSFDDAVHTGPYPYGFAPTFHAHKINEPRKIKTPSKIFVCSMADLFGEWVPVQWIYTVFDACMAAPQHIYMFLTKNPEAMGDSVFGWRNSQLGRLGWDPPANWWFGTTVTCQDDVHRIMKLPADTPNRFVSFEPLQGPITLTQEEMEYLSWIIIGQETGTRKTDFNLKWCTDLLFNYVYGDCSFFVKDSIKLDANKVKSFPPRMLRHLEGKIPGDYLK